MLSFGFRIFCWYRGFCHRTGSDLLLFLFSVLSMFYVNYNTENENFACFGRISSEVTFNRCNTY